MREQNENKYNLEISMDDILNCYKGLEINPKILSELNNVLPRINAYINDLRIQSQVAADYNNKRYKLFDPSFGDDGCQTRPILILPIIAKKLSYQDLSKEDKLYLTLCHILRNYKRDLRDEYGLLFDMKIDISSIKYGPANRLLKVPSTKNLSAEQVLQMLGQLNATMSVAGMRLAGKQLQDEKLLESVTTNYRQQPKNKGELGDSFPVEPTTPAMMVLFKQSELMNINILLKVTRIEYLEKENNFICQGADILPYRYNNQKNILVPLPLNEIKDDAKKEAIVIECFSIKSSKSSFELNGNHAILNNANSFMEFKERLKDIDLLDYILTLGTKDDFAKSKPVNKEYLARYIQQADYLKDFDMKYACKEKPVRIGYRMFYSNDIKRNDQSVPLSVVHLYVSDYDTEYLSVKNLPCNRPVGYSCQEYDLTEGKSAQGASYGR